MRFIPELYFGQVMHRRLRPVDHTFVYPVFFVRLPLRHLHQARHPLFSINRFNVLSFNEREHGARDGSPLISYIERLLIAHQLPHEGEIILQTFPRLLGYVFNPVSFWYCHNREGALIAVLAEVNNTFGGTHSYFLHQSGAPLSAHTEHSADKLFHVSPFNKIEGTYRFRFTEKEHLMTACIDYDDTEGPLLLTAITGRAQAWTTRTIMLAMARYPLMTVLIIARIHWQALILWWRRVPFYGAHAPTKDN